MMNILSKKKGLVLTTVMLITVIFIIVIIPLVAWTINEYSWTVRSFRTLKALNLADAGADLAIWEIIHNEAGFSGWSGINPKTRTISSFTDNFGDVAGDVDISVLNTATNTYLITAAGHVASTNNQTIDKTVKALVFPHALFNNGIFGTDSVTISGTPLADSYDSNEGPYNEVLANDNCDVGTNGKLTVTGDSHVEGSIIIGPEGTVIGDIPAHVTGETYYSANEIELEEISLPEEFLSLENLGDLTLSSSDALTLVTDDYFFESIDLKAQSTLTINNNTRIYVLANFSVAGQATVSSGDSVEIYIGGNGAFAGGGIINTSTVPGNLEIYGLGNGTTLSFSGNSAFYGAIYAPHSSISLTGTSDYFGAVAAQDIVLQGTANLHYDENLRSDGPTEGYAIAYWQED